MCASTIKSNGGYPNRHFASKLFMTGFENTGHACHGLSRPVIRLYEPCQGCELRWYPTRVEQAAVSPLRPLSKWSAILPQVELLATELRPAFGAISEDTLKERL